MEKDSDEERGERDDASLIHHCDIVHRSRDREPGQVRGQGRCDVRCNDLCRPGDVHSDSEEPVPSGEGGARGIGSGEGEIGSGGG